MVLHTNITDRLAGMRKTIDQITHTIAKTTRSNAPSMITADQHHEIDPTPRRAAQAITNEMEHRSMKKRINTRIK
jgi:hypothetical protein